MGLHVFSQPATHAFDRLEIGSSGESATQPKRMVGATSRLLLRQRRREKIDARRIRSVGRSLFAPGSVLCRGYTCFAVCTFPPPTAAHRVCVCAPVPMFGPPASRWVYVLARQRHVFPDLPPCASTWLFVCFAFVFFCFSSPHPPPPPSSQCHSAPTLRPSYYVSLLALAVSSDLLFYSLAATGQLINQIFKQCFSAQWEVLDYLWMLAVASAATYDHL